MISPGRIRHHKPLRFAGEAPRNDPTLLVRSGAALERPGTFAACPSRQRIYVHLFQLRVEGTVGTAGRRPPCAGRLEEGLELLAQVVYESRSVEEGGETNA